MDMIIKMLDYSTASLAAAGICFLFKKNGRFGTYIWIACMISYIGSMFCTYGWRTGIAVFPMYLLFVWWIYDYWRANG